MRTQKIIAPITTGASNRADARYDDREYDLDEEREYPWRYYEPDNTDNSVNAHIEQTSVEITQTVHHHAPVSAKAILAVLALLAGLFGMYAVLPYLHTIMIIALVAGGVTLLGIITRFVILPIVAQVQSIGLTRREARWLQPHDERSYIE